MNPATTSFGHGLAIGIIAMGIGTNMVTAEAAEVTVLSAPGMRRVLPDLAEAFRQETGHSVRPSFGGSGEVQKRVEAGEAIDIVIATGGAMEQIAGRGLVVQETRTVIARGGVGVGVREGAPKPDISSTDTFKQTLLSAKSVGYADPAGGSLAGNHVSRVIERLGISQAIKGKAVLDIGGNVCERVAKGEIELCVHAISDILPVKGVTLVGPLPRDVQNVEMFVAALSTRSSAGETARAFITFLARPSSRAKFAEAGLDFRQE